jgi:hypothetical protein
MNLHRGIGIRRFPQNEPAAVNHFVSKEWLPFSLIFYSHLLVSRKYVLL